MTENVVAVTKNKDGEKKIISEHDTKHSADTVASPKKHVVSEHKKEFTIDAILIEQDKDEEEESKTKSD